MQRLLMIKIIIIKNKGLGENSLLELELAFFLRGGVMKCRVCMNRYIEDDRHPLLYFYCFIYHPPLLCIYILSLSLSVFRMKTTLMDVVWLTNTIATLEMIYHFYTFLCHSP